jgi:hypothetical protein
MVTTNSTVTAIARCGRGRAITIVGVPTLIAAAKA